MEIWQLDVLVMKIIHIKNYELKLDFYPYLKLLYSALHCLQKSEKSHQGKRQSSNFYIINICLLITIYKNRYSNTCIKSSDLI